MKRVEIGHSLTTLRSTRLWRFNVFVFLMLLASGLSAAPPFVWNRTAPCPLGRFEAMGGAAEGKLYQFSGFYNTAIDATVECDAYDPVSNVWTRIADIPRKPLLIRARSMMLILARFGSPADFLAVFGPGRVRPKFGNIVLKTTLGRRDRRCQHHEVVARL
jgi:hypothetical protein